MFNFKTFYCIYYILQIQETGLKIKYNVFVGSKSNLKDFIEFKCQYKINMFHL
jgi:hypothetical protein